MWEAVIKMKNERLSDNEDSSGLYTKFVPVGTTVPCNRAISFKIVIL